MIQKISKTRFENHHSPKILIPLILRLFCWFWRFWENPKIEILDFHQLRKALSQKPTRSTVWNFSMLFVETIRLIYKKLKIITVTQIFRKSIRKSTLTKILIPLILRSFWRFWWFWWFWRAYELEPFISTRITRHGGKSKQLNLLFLSSWAAEK